MTNGTTIKVPNTNRQAGVINSSNDFVTYRTEKSFFRKYNGFGISLNVLGRLRKNGVKKINIIFEDTKGIKIKRKLYTTTLEDFYNFGTEYRHKSDFQLVLNLDRFKTNLIEEID